MPRTSTCRDRCSCAEHLAAGFVRPLDDLVGDTSDFFAPLLDCNRWTGRFGDPLGVDRCSSSRSTASRTTSPMSRRCSRRPASACPTPGTRTSMRRGGSSDASGCAALPARHGRVAHDVDGLRDAALVVRRSGLRGRPLRDRVYGRRRRDGGFRGRAPRRRAGGLAGPALVRARPRFRPGPLRADRGLRPLRRVLRGSGGLTARRADRLRAAARRPGRATVEPVDVVGGGQHPSRDLDAVRRFLEWATGRSFLLRSAFEGNMNPTRRSSWDDDRFRAHTAGWGDFHDVARNLIERDASVLVTPAPTTSPSRRAGSPRCSPATRRATSAASSRPRLRTSTSSSDLLDGDPRTSRHAHGRGGRGRASVV